MEKPGTQDDLSLNYEFEKHVNLSTQWNRWMLKPLGVWPQSQDTSLGEKLYYWLTTVVCYGLITFLFVPCCLYMILEVQDLYNKVKLFGPLIFCLMAFAKYYSLIAHENDIRECVECIKWDWKNISYHDDRNIMVMNANFGTRLGIISAIFLHIGFSFYFIAIPISTGKITVEGENLTYVPLAFPFSRLITNTRISPTNEIVYSVQLLAGFLMHEITAAVCSLAAMLATHACGQMQILSNWLKHLIDGRVDMSQTVDGRIADIVSGHVRILKFLALTEKTMQQLSFTEFVGCTADICLVGYYVIMDWKSNDVTGAVTFTILFISITFNIFIFCYVGELVAEQCTKVGEMSYMIEWYRLNGKRKLCCVLIIAMSNSSTKLTAGNMVELSINTFASVVKTSFAFLNVLRTTI